MVTRSRPKAATPRVNLATGNLEMAEGATVELDSDDWFHWLDHADHFYVNHPAGNFSCRRDGRARGGTYWSAFRRVQGHVERAYLGKSERVTMTRLREVGNDLAAEVQPTREQTTVAPQARRNQIASEIAVADVTTDDSYVWLTLVDKRVIGAPLAWFPRLAQATPEARALYTIRGAGVHWPTIDEDISARVLMGHAS